MSVAPTDDRLLTLVGEIQGMLDLDEFRHGLLNGLLAVMPSDWASINDVRAPPADVVFVARPDSLGQLGEVFARLAHENPLIDRFQRTQDGRAYRFSDVVTTEELHALAIYREFYAVLGIEHQIAFVLRTEPDAFLGVALSRCDHDFTDDDRALLDHARPFIIQAYRNALAHTRVVRRLADREEPQRPLETALTAAGLTPREAAVVSRLALGQAVADIAEALEIGERTARKHLENSYRKLGVDSRSAAAGVAWRLLDGGAVSDPTSL